MKTNDQIKKAIEDAFDAETKATPETVAEACAAVQEKATAIFGAGVYVKGRMDADMQGVTFTYKRPSIRQRLSFFIPCEVDKPPRNPEAGEESQRSGRASKRSDAQDNAGSGSSGSSDVIEDRLLILEEAAIKLTPEQYTRDGRPEVGPVNALLAEGVEPFTAKERDEVWSRHQAPAPADE